VNHGHGRAYPRPIAPCKRLARPKSSTRGIMSLDAPTLVTSDSQHSFDELESEMRQNDVAMDLEFGNGFDHNSLCSYCVATASDSDVC